MNDVKCKCNLCEAKNQGCHPYELVFGRNTFAAELVRANPDLPIYVYERWAKLVLEGVCPKWTIHLIKNYNKDFSIIINSYMGKENCE